MLLISVSLGIPNDKDMKSRLFNIAWSVADKFATFSEALTYAWKVIKLQWSLLCGTVSFSYRKVDGSIRKAAGTLDVKYDFKGGKPNKSMFSYWDVEANAWRGCLVQNLIF